MATQTADKKTKKRKRHNNNSPMLLVHDRVEVRSIDEGFMGSWHSAVVISLKNRVREVQYDCLLSDDGSQRLIEQIDVHPVFDGGTPVDRMRLFHRGLIRPLPPPLDFDTLSVHYGQCVDAYYQEAWWEGVVFDHENDSEIRFIFFPDIGDLLQIRVDNLRITQDWDEFTQEWEPRGNWIFLELIEQIKQENFIHISVREIWYEVREKDGFEKLKEWTNSSTSSDVWESLVMEVIDEHFKLVAEMFYGKCQLKKSDTADCSELYTSSLVTEKNEISLDGLLTKPNSEEEGRRLEASLLSSSNSTTHVKEFPTALYDKSSILEDSEQIRDDSGSCVSDQLIEKNNVNECQIAVHDNDVLPGVEICPDSVFNSKMDEGRGLVSSSNSETTHEETLFNAQSIKPCNAAAVVDACYIVKDRDIASNESPSDRRTKRKWEIAGTDIVPEAEFCPDSVMKYLKRSKSKYHRESLKLSLRKHLAYLGWKIEVCREEGFSRMRYTSPKGKCYMSLVTVCKDWVIVQNSSTGAGRGKKRKACAPRLSSHVLISSRPRHGRGEPANFPEAVKYYANLIGSGIKNRNIVWPENATPRDVRDKAKRHLRASGWSIWTNEAGKKQVLRYTSPSGKTYSSLLTACKAYIEGEVDSGVEADLSLKPRQGIDACERLPSKILKEPVEFGQATVEEHHNEGSNGGALSLNCNSLLQRKGQKTVYPKKKREKKLDASGKVRDDMDGDDPVQCSKIAVRQLDPSSSFCSSLTVLSWLIDNDVVLPRMKVYYLGKKVCAPTKEGLITREGIKCNCCKIVFGLTKFQAHSESTRDYDQPAANIYLEDGRSLLSCQSQLRNRYGIKNMLTPPPQPKSRRTNDYICSVCHFGGLLVMCDHCPSSFHCECLDLKDIPDGEWFCPQCCCRICGSNKFNGGAKQTTDSILYCHQCERRYHVGCLLKEGKTNVESYSEGIWFCNTKCEQIFLGLQKLLGKPVVVGDGNLTWTLLKYIPRNDDLDGYGTEPLVETFSKLSLVVSVMHECFEPMHAPGTKKDIVEDVIFSRGSDLSRLNFEGFYTVLLSRDDEVITVAAVRVHGDKVAEIPLVGTRFQYRKLGMCRFLMNELEKKLVELGVERLVMPAAPSVLSTWTTSFGFSKVAESERSNFRGYTFLDFQGAVMCQKILTESVQPIRTLQNIYDNVGESTTVTSNKSSTSSEEFQAERRTEVEIAHQGAVDSVVATGADGGNGTSPLVLQVNQQIIEKVKQLELLVEERGGDGSKEIDNNNQSRIFKCYKRRRVLSAC